MILLTRTYGYLPGKGQEACKNALAISAYLKSAHGITTIVSSPVAGNPFLLRFSSQWDSLAALEAGFAKVAADPRYLELTGKNASLVVPGSVNDEIHQTF